MDYRKQFIVAPGAELRLSRIDPDFSDGLTPAAAQLLIDKNIERMKRLQYLLYANASRALLIVLQAPDAGGKDGLIRHLFSGLNPQGVSVTSFKEPSHLELAHDFLWRAHIPAPQKGVIAIFNRSYYENVLVVRVRGLEPEAQWSKYYGLIEDFEKLLDACGTRVLKFYLHIGPKEQLKRFKKRLDDPDRQWKLAESDFTDRRYWPAYDQAYEDALRKTSAARAPWFVIPANRKWFRNLAVSQIVADELEDMGLKAPPPRADMEKMRRLFEAAEKAKGGG